MKKLIWVLFLSACGVTGTEAEPGKQATTNLTTDQWPPASFSTELTIPAGNMVVGDAVVIRAAMFVESVDGGPGTFVFTPLLYGPEIAIDRLTTAEVPLSYPEYDHIFIEWMLHATTPGEAVTYGTITATDINQGTTIRGGYRDIDFDVSVEHKILIGIGRTGGPGVITARLLSLTMKR